MPVDYAKYPFLVNIDEYLARNHPGLGLADLALLSEDVSRNALRRI